MEGNFGSLFSVTFGLLRVAGELAGSYGCRHMWVVLVGILR